MRKMRRRAALTLLSAGVAMACPVKPGFIAAGIMKTPTGIHPLCELVKTLKQPQLNWVEAYKLDPGRADTILRQLLVVLNQKGYRTVTDDRRPGAITIGLEGPLGQLIIQRGLNNGTHLLVIAQPK